MRASAPTAFANFNILAAMAEGFVNPGASAIAGNIATDFTNEGKHHELGHYQG
jgi:hypothetical protein